jgi:hypothetical protein
VEISFAGAPPVRLVERASGVSEVEAEGHTLRCVVCGSFQPLLEALRGAEVLNITTHAEDAH